MIESKRGCGYRVLDGLYLRGTGLSVPCDRLPFILEYCPVCGSGIKFSRGYQMIDWKKYAGEHKRCRCRQFCPICHPKDDVKHAIMWVGNQHYSPDEFITEAQKMGICKRIASVPRGIEFGKTWILLGHKKAGTKMVPTDDKQVDLNKKPVMKQERVPAIFYAFKPTHIEKIITKRQSRNKKLIKSLKKKGITPIIATKVNKKGEVMETKELK